MMPPRKLYTIKLRTTDIDYLVYLLQEIGKFIPKGIHAKKLAKLEEKISAQAFEQMSEHITFFSDINTPTRRQCPVCKIHKTYAGQICPKCISLGYQVTKNGKIKRKEK